MFVSPQFEDCGKMDYGRVAGSVHGPPQPEKKKRRTEYARLFLPR
ncbi:hypothetical protein HMPREF9440_02399 [Sutterella parvirubra YIT 11816]|uniref:Uncharacterized protein n=1 Tax=Sutterella parvirubra YIT 11816 TaxID=762967 RepID=H3KHZ8_9BURK|nr:hypothetical protein HMPREF9440_02399 [Sutterella parvirubra YIT 11816]